jgi:hypothetical protein
LYIEHSSLCVIFTNFHPCYSHQTEIFSWHSDLKYFKFKYAVPIQSNCILKPYKTTSKILFCFLYHRCYFGIWAEMQIAQGSYVNEISYCFYTSLSENISWQMKKTFLKLSGSASLLFYQSLSDITPPNNNRITQSFQHIRQHPSRH